MDRDSTSGDVESGAGRAPGARRRPVWGWPVWRWRGWLLLAAGAAWAGTGAGVVLDVADLRVFFDSLSDGGRSYFFTREICTVLRGTLLVLGPTALFVPLLWRRLGQPLPAPDPGPRGRFAAVQLLLALGILASGLARLAADPPTTTDTKFYLSESLDTARNGGLAALPGRCFRGEYLEENRHPLYPGVLATVAEESGRFTDRARTLSLVGALVAFFLATSWMRRVWGEAGGLLGGVLLATSGVFLEQSRIVACESWLMAFSIPWFARLEREGAGARGLAVAGAFAGLLFLTKGTGTLYVGATLVALALCDRLRAWRPALVFLGVFALVASPLLWRNATVFHNPFYNVNSTHVLWLDHWEEFYDPRVLHAAGPLAWLRSHGVGDILSRLAVGGTKETIHLLEAFSPFSPGLGLGLPVLVASVLCVVRDPDRRRRTLTVVLFALFFLSFAWYAKVVQGARFLAVLVPLLLAPLARLGPQLFSGGRGLVALRAGAVATAVVLIAIGVGGGALRWSPNRFQPGPATTLVHDFLLEHVGERRDVHYLLGPSDRLTHDWDYRIRGARHTFPRNQAEYERLLEGNAGAHLRYAVVERRGGAWPERFDARWVRARDDGGLAVGDPPEGWTLERALPPERPTVLVFERR